MIPVAHHDRAAADGLRNEIERLGALDLASLRQRWRRIFRKAAPEGLPKALLHRALAYRLQEDALGGLDRATRQALDRMAGEGGAVIPLPDRRGTKPGTVLVREWQGTVHSVMILADGFAWNGRTFGSLSEVAFAITGTRWNGPRFFGLRSTSKTGRA